MNLADAALGLNPANYYPIIAMISALGIVITAAYILRAVGNVFLGEYLAEKWHDMRPLLAIDKFTLVVFCVCLIGIGIFPAVIAPIVESGMAPVVERLQNVHQTASVLDTVQTAATNLFAWLGGA